MISCECCNFHTIIKANYKRHIETKKHLDNKHRILKKEEEEEDYICKYCGKYYKHKQSMHKHIKYHCHKNKDEDLKELVRLMNLQLDQKEKQIECLSSQMIKQNKHMDRQSKQIEKLMDKLQVTNITNNTTNIQNNIKLLCYKDTDTSHLTDEDYINSIKKVNFCVKHLIEKIHFNPDKPENMNIYISNIKDKYIMVYEDGKWNIKQKDKEINDLYENKEMLLEDWITEYQDDYPGLKEKYEKYLNNRENDEIMDSIKEEIKLMLYNKKNNFE